MADLKKIVDELSALTVLEAAELKKMLEEAWGVEAAAPMAMGAMPMMMGAMPTGGAAAPAEEVEEQTEFNVILKEIGPKKIEVIKVVRALTNLGLKEAKDLVEGAPSNVLEAVTKEAAADAKSQLEGAGAVIEVK
jgi:large subunit ribosomal protein L7/L12